MSRVFFAAMVIGGLALSSVSFGYSGGSGTPEEPYRIATKADLLELADNTADYNKCFILTADINMEGQVFARAIIAADTSSSGGFQGTAFTGTFDGNSHKITNFTINGGSNDYLGLFGQSYGGSVKNLGLENYAVSGFYKVGGLVGENVGSIINCYSTSAVSGGLHVGGLVGYNYGGDVNNCYSTGSVSGILGVGGLVGYNNGGGTNNCYSTGAVSGTYSVGGLVGHNYGSISDCYSTGSVSGSDYVGGLVGNDYGGGIISNCYFLVSSGPVNGCGTPLTDEEMKQQSSFVGWDFVGETTNGTGDIWRMCIDGVNYPLLRWQFNTADFVCPDGVNFIDFAILANAWLSDPVQANWNGRCDIAEPPDDIIDMLDLAIFCDNWLE